MLSFNIEKKNCSGCGACYSVCPKQCISMVRDEEGFDYPELTSPNTCINCKLCEKVCPINTSFHLTVTQRAFAAVSKDYSIWHRSASGGAFSEICKAWGDENTFVVGAAWNGLDVHHIMVKGVDNIKPLCNSKYVASRIEDAFREIRDKLAENKVIFCGTPCQVSGLRSFLHKEYENLLTIDLICHGVGSPTVFKTCTNLISKQAGEQLQAYAFRAKRRIYETDYLAALSFSKSKLYVTQDQYMQLFLKQICLRPSCGQNCKYRGRIRRPGDFTIADFKGLSSSFPDLLGTKRNYSTIVCNSEKATTLIPQLKKQMEMREVTIEDIIKYNPLFDGHTWFSNERDKFFVDFSKDHEGTVLRYTTPYKPFYTSIKGAIFNILPTWMRKIYLRK